MDDKAEWRSGNPSGAGLAIAQYYVERKRRGKRDWRQGSEKKALFVKKNVKGRTFVWMLNKTNMKST